MTPRDLSPFLRRLNDHCTATLSEAASLCETRAHRDVTVEHWLIKLLEQGDGDLSAIVRRYALDVDVIWNGLLSAIDRLPHSLRGKPGLSPQLGQLLQAAWLRTSLTDGDAAIRSADLLAALVDSPHLLRAPEAWPLLSLSVAQIDRLKPELDQISVEAASTLSSRTAERDTEPNDMRRDAPTESAVAPSRPATEENAAL